MMDTIKKRFESNLSNFKFKILDEKSLRDMLAVIEQLVENPELNVMIIHDKDADGITAGNIFYYMLKEIGVGRIKHFHLRDVSTANDNEVVKKLRNTDIIFSLDLPFADTEQIERIVSNKRLQKMVIIDHHPTYNLGHEKLVIIKADKTFECDEPTKYCTAKMAYDLADLIVDVSHMDWICTIGIIADIAYPIWPEFIKDVFDKYGFEWKSNENDDLHASELGILAQLVGFGNAFYPDRVKDVFNAVKSSANHSELESKLGFCKEVSKAVSDNVEQFMDKCHVQDDVYIYELVSDFQIVSQVATTVSLKNTHKNIIVYRHVNDKTTFALRRNDFAINVGVCSRKASSKLKGASGGGHIPAAGGRCMRADHEQFIDFIVSEFNNPQNKVEES